MTLADDVMTVRDAIAVLREAGVPSSEHDARALDVHARATGQDLRSLVERRAAREPLQHIVGSTGFRYIDVVVGPGVFVPRPESEVVAGFAIDAARASGDGAIVVDLCTGSGAIALAIANEVSGARVHAVEKDSRAVEWLRRNAGARASAGDPPVVVHVDDVLDALPDMDGSVDVLVSNPPYVAEDEMADVDPEVRDHDPRVALVAGDEGLAVIRDVATAAWRLLRPGGVVVVEHSDRQGETAPALLRAVGFVDVRDELDLAGRPRVAIGAKP